jgi:hypothetical protein
MTLPVEKVLAARVRTIPDTTESPRQGRAALARTVQDPLPEPPTEFFNRQDRYLRQRGSTQEGLLNDLGGLGEHVRRNGEAEGLGGLGVDHEVEGRRLLHR